MKISWVNIAWFIFSVAISSYVALVAFSEPLKFVPFTDLLATILSILIGLSLAIAAILSSRPIISTDHFKSENEKRRLEKILREDDTKLQDGQFLLFWFYYISLILAVVLKFIGVEGSETLCLKIISSGFAFIASLSLLWSATLPSLLKKLNEQRRLLQV